MHNPAPIQSLQVDLGFKHRLVMDMAKDMTRTAVQLTNASCPFCLSYYLKDVCNSNCGRRHVHRRLSTTNYVLLAVWKEQF